MECKRIKELLSPYLDKELTGKETALVEEHLRRCSRCPGELERLKRTVHLVSSLEEVEPPKDFLSEIHRKMRVESRLKRFLNKVFFPLPIKLPLEALAAVLIAAVIISLNRYYPSGPPPREMAKRLPAGLERQEMRESAVKGEKFVAGKEGERVAGARRAPDETDKLFARKGGWKSIPEREENISSGLSKLDVSEESMTVAGHLEQRALPANYQVQVSTKNIPLGLIKAQKVIYLNKGKIISPSDKDIVTQIASKEIRHSRILFEMPFRNYSQVLTQLKEVGKVTSIIPPKKAEKDKVRLKKSEEKSALIHVQLELTQSENE